MYHQRSSFSFGGDSASQNVNVLRNVQNQNENMIHRGNSLKSSASTNKSSNDAGGKKLGLSKTPHGKSTSTRRRAFGDISNKKASNNVFGKEPSSKQKEVLKPRSNTNLLPRSIRKAPSTQNTRFAILPEQPKPFRLEGSLQKADRNTIGQKPLSTTTAQVKSHHKKAEPFPDIERPAGRTWKQQLEYDLKDEDDLASLSSIDSLLNLKNSFSPRWEQERDLLWKEQQEKHDEEDQKVRKHIQTIMDREEKEAQEELDRLYGAIDDLELFSHHSDGSVHDDLSGFGDLNLSDDLLL